MIDEIQMAYSAIIDARSSDCGKFMDGILSHLNKVTAETSYHSWASLAVIGNVIESQKISIDKTRLVKLLDLFDKCIVNGESVSTKITLLPVTSTQQFLFFIKVIGNIRIDPRTNSMHSYNEVFNRIVTKFLSAIPDCFANFSDGDWRNNLYCSRGLVNIVAT